MGCSKEDGLRYGDFVVADRVAVLVWILFRMAHHPLFTNKKTF
jgi:hypothetical protein